MRSGGIELLNIDCMEYMSTVPDKHFDLAIVDPPYQGNDAIGLINGNGHAANRKDYHVFKNVMPDQKYFDELKRVSKNQIVWGGNFFGLSGGVIAWNKNGTAFGEGEVAICSTHKSVRFFEYTWNGMTCKDCKKQFTPYEVEVDCVQCDDGDYLYEREDYEGGSYYGKCRCCNGRGSYTYKEKIRCEPCHNYYFERDEDDDY